jgi:osmoprotectant transport system permease protein
MVGVAPVVMPPLSGSTENRNPLVRWDYVVDQSDDILAALLQHLELTLLAVVVGLAVSAPLAALALRKSWATSAITGFTGFLYTIPSVALFALLVPVFGFSRVSTVIPLASYTLLILVTNIIEGFRSVPESVVDSANAMGLTPVRRVWSVELPLAMPSIITGIRIATVSTVGLLTVAAIIGQGGLGRLILDGLRRGFWTPMTVGAVLSVMLALALDVLILWLGRAATPWTRTRRTTTAVVR